MTEQQAIDHYRKITHGLPETVDGSMADAPTDSTFRGRQFADWESWLDELRGNLGDDPSDEARALVESETQRIAALKA